MDNLDEQFNKYIKSSEFKKLVDQKSKSDSNFGGGNGSGGTKELAVQMGKRMKEILQDEITNVMFLDHIIVEEEFVTGKGWIVNVSFNESKVKRDSLWKQGYPNGAYLPTLFDNGYTAKNHVYGKDSHGVFRISLLHRDGLHFIEKAVNRFNSENSNGVKAEYNSVYKDGTLERGDLASLYF